MTTRLLRWIVSNLGVALGMAAATAAAAGLYQATECSASQYATLRSTLATGSASYVLQLREEARDGKVSRWAFAGLLRSYWEGATVLVAPGSSGDLEAERVALLKALGHDAPF